VLTPAPRRTDADACPGALRLHAAADGPLARVRLPGGRITGAQLRAVREMAEAWGDGHVELTSRANLQLRALTGVPVEELAGALRAAGLLPSDTHELVRNIVASPLPAGWDVHGLDRALCADPRLADLPGRFLFSLGLPTGDVAAVRAGGTVAVLLAGADVGLRVSPAGVTAALLAAAHAFLDEREAQGSGAWRLAELTDGPARVAARLSHTDPAPRRTGVPLERSSGTPASLFGPHSVPANSDSTARLTEPIGIVDQPDGGLAVGALVPLGRLGGEALAALEKAGQLVVTPWRGVLVTDLVPSAAAGWLAALARAGLEVSADSRWAGVTACAGRPGCAKALADVRHDATGATRFGDGLPVHWIGCARGCGSPSAPHVRVEATGAGYAVTAPDSAATGTTAEVGELVAAARRG
jgi:precorrin-3B synthase